MLLHHFYFNFILFVHTVRASFDFNWYLQTVPFSFEKGSYGQNHYQISTTLYKDPPAKSFIAFTVGNSSCLLKLFGKALNCLLVPIENFWRKLTNLSITFIYLCVLSCENVRVKHEIQGWIIWEQAAPTFSICLKKGNLETILKYF